MKKFYIIALLLAFMGFLSCKSDESVTHISIYIDNVRTLQASVNVEELDSFTLCSIKGGKETVFFQRVSLEELSKGLDLQEDIYDFYLIAYDNEATYTSHVRLNVSESDILCFSLIKED